LHYCKSTSWVSSKEHKGGQEVKPVTLSIVELKASVSYLVSRKFRKLQKLSFSMPGNCGNRNVRLVFGKLISKTASA